MSNPPNERPPAGPPRPYHFPPFTRSRGANGMGILSASVHKLPLISVAAVFDAGAMRDPDGREGLAVLTAKMLLEGTEEMEGTRLADAFEQLGATVEAHAGWDDAVIELTVLRSNLEPAMALLRDALRTPAFRERDISRLKAERQAERLQIRTEPRELADESFERYLYAPDTRYSRPLGGSAESIAATTREDVLGFYRGRYTPDRLTLIMAGDVDDKTVAQLAERAFGDWASAGKPNRPTTDKTAVAERQIQIVSKPDAPQSELRIGHRGVPRSHPDYFPLVLMNAVLGGLFSSRINLNLRERHGYAYGAHSSFEWRREHGPFVVSTAVESGVTADAAREVIAEIDSIRQTPIADEELSLATSYLEGVFPIRFETTAAIARAMTALVTYDYPPDYFDTYRANVRAVTKEDVLRVARAHLHPERLLTIAVGDPALIAEPLRRLQLGDVTIAEGADVDTRS